MVGTKPFTVEVDYEESNIDSDSVFQELCNQITSLEPNGLVFRGEPLKAVSRSVPVRCIATFRFEQREDARKFIEVCDGVKGVIPGSGRILDDQT